MATVLLTFLLLLTVIAIMAVGVMFGRQPIKGSCGGMAALGMKDACDICGGDDQKCESASRRGGMGGADLAYPADRRDG